MTEHGGHWRMGVSYQRQQGCAQQGELRQPVGNMALALFQEHVDNQNQTGHG